MSVSSTIKPPIEGHVTFALTREELYMVMRMLQAQQLPGFDLDWLHMTPEGKLLPETFQALEHATNALIARGFLQPSEEPTNPEIQQRHIKLTVPSPILATVGTCAFAENTLIVPLRVSNEARILYLHTLHELVVLHTMPFPDIHQFEAVSGQDAIFYLLNKQLMLQQQQSNGLPVGNAFAVHINAARDAALAGKIEEATETLVRGGLSVEMAQALAQSIHNALAIGAVVALQRKPDGSQSQDQIAIIVTSDTCFVLEDKQGKPASMIVQSVSVTAIQDWVRYHLSHTTSNNTTNTTNIRS